MKKHLFLEGPIQEGKSTLIRKLIKVDLSQIGGFSSQRLIDDAGETVGFRIASAEEALDLTKAYSPELSDVFLHFGGEHKQTMLQVFEDTAVRYLRESKGKKLILLDEIGGVELLSSEFMRELYHVLEGDVPCLGVLKLESRNRKMCDIKDTGKDCRDRYLELRNRLINQYNSEIVYFERKNAAKTEKAIRDFLLSKELLSCTAE